MEEGVFSRGCLGLGFYRKLVGRWGLGLYFGYIVFYICVGLEDVAFGIGVSVFDLFIRGSNWKVFRIIFLWSCRVRLRGFREGWMV